MKKEKTIDILLKDLNHEYDLEKPCSSPYVPSKKVSSKVQVALKELDLKRNHSFAVEMINRNKKNLNADAIFYRGIRISYEEMFTNAYKYAKSLKSMGFNKGDSIPVCITNTPEFVYLFIAISMIGCKINVVGDWFDNNYLTEILNNTNSKYVFVDDISYAKIKECIKNSCVDKIVCLPISTTLEKNNGNPYKEVDDIFNNFNNESIADDVIFEDEFIQMGSSYSDFLIENVDLNDAFTQTYTSGTTSPGRPKGVIQSNRSYITLSRFKESDVSGMPMMKNMSVLAHIPTYTHMELSCAISDTLYCGCTLCLEPYYNKDFFPYSLLINKPNFVPASSGFWVKLGKKLMFDPEFKNVTMPFLSIPTVTGEELSPGEEKFLNKVSKQKKFGVDKLPFPLSPAKYSIGGGTTESSGIFVTLFKSLQEKNPKYVLTKTSLGLTPHKFVDLEVLRTDGTYCNDNEPGLLVANSPCEMLGYTAEELNKTTHIIDAYGKKWLNLGTYSYKDGTGRVKMKGRMGDFIKTSNGKITPLYLIEDVILLDKKNVMSCTAVFDTDKNIVVFIEFQPDTQISEKKVLKSIYDRLKMTINHEILEKLYVRVLSFEESFPLDPSGKRSRSTLKKMGIDETTKPFEDINYNQEIKKEKVKKIGNKKF